MTIARLSYIMPKDVSLSLGVVVPLDNNPQRGDCGNMAEEIFLCRVSRCYLWGTIAD